MTAKKQRRQSLLDGEVGSFPNEDREFISQVVDAEESHIPRGHRDLSDMDGTTSFEEAWEIPD